jgi:hypothetical protein
MEWLQSFPAFQPLASPFALSRALQNGYRAAALWLHENGCP